MIRVYGYSDDNLVVEGAPYPNDEISCFDRIVRISFTDGTIIDAWYGKKGPERKVGKWTEDNACEFCGFKPWYERDIHTLSYCPNCGADMRGKK